MKTEIVNRWNPVALGSLQSLEFLPIFCTIARSIVFIIAKIRNKRKIATTVLQKLHMFLQKVSMAYVIMNVLILLLTV